MFDVHHPYSTTIAAGDLVTFGSGESGRLGHGSETDTLRPREALLRFQLSNFLFLTLKYLIFVLDK